MMNYETSEGEVLASHSTFVVLATGISLFTSSAVLNASNSIYAVRYVFRVGLVSGDVTITYQFRDTGPPKVNAERHGQLILPLIWVAYTADTFVFNDTSAVDFSSLPEPLDVTPRDLSLTIGPDTDPLNWTRRLGLDWSDAGAGTAYVGPLSLGSLSGPAVFVVFPADMSVVDPTTSGTSTSSSGTDHSIQRKTFEYGGRYWAFWYDGGSIAYASSQMSYSNGGNSLAPWTAKMIAPAGSLPSGIDYRGFDVDQRGGIVLVGYIASGLTSMKILVGTITGSFVSWFGPYTVSSWSTAEAGLPSVAIGSDGYFWAALVWKSFGFTYVDRWRSIDQGSTAFARSSSDSLSGIPSDSAVRLVALSNGYLIEVTSTKGYSTITTKRYGAGSWGSTLTWDIKLPTLDGRGGILSALARKDDSVYIAFKGDNTNAPGLRYVVLSTSDTLSPAPPNPPGTIDATSNPNQPTLALDMNGDLHVFWLYVDGAPFRWHIRYSRQVPDGGSWTAYTEPWSYVGQQRMGLTASVLAGTQVSVLWTEGDFSPYNVYFGAVETPMDLGSQTGQPWNRQGLSPFESYFQQLSEFVSPGSGLLTIRQTDLTLPGRKLDLEIARVFITPRAFGIAGSTPSPYLFEDYPAANLGRGWSFDFPWISSQYLHLPGGQMYVLKWQADSFENHDGEHFVLTRTCSPSCYYYTLNSKNGIRYDFNPSKQLTGIRDPSGNIVSFTYTSGRIDHINDTIGRTVAFTYNPDGTLVSIASGSQTVGYTYSASGVTVLKSVSDSLGRKTQFDYTDARNSYLLTAITYPTGAKSAYSWSNPAVIVGSDLQAYYVTLQDTLNAAGQSIRANQYDYTVLNGKVTYAKVTTSAANVAQGSTVLMYDLAGSKSTTIRRDATGLQLDKHVTRFSSRAVAQVEFYPGAATTPSYATYAAYDDWGNVIYSRDAVGHERFASYVNTRYQGGFFAPGRMTRSLSGYVFYDDFDNRDLSDWILDTTAGTVGLDYQTFESAPPALRVAHSGAPSGVAAATHLFPAESDYFVAEAVVRAAETTRHHFVLLRSTSNALRVYASLSYSGYVAWSTDGITWNDVTSAPYQANQWSRLGFVVDVSAGTYDIWFNGQQVKTGAALTGTGSIDRFNFQASYSGGPAATMFVDMAEVYTGGAVVVSGLQNGQLVLFEDAQARVVKALKAVGTSVTWSTTPGVLPYVRVEIFDPDGLLTYSGPVYELWGGDSWTFTQPWKALPTRSQSGFLRYSALYVDDSYPTGAVPGNAEDGWDWGPYDFPPSGSSSHRSKYLTGTHQHNFVDATSTLAMGSGQFHIQYVYIPAGQYPSEIMLQFRDTANSEQHRAYWGSNLIPWGTDGTNSRRSMGGLPTQAGRWLMLIVKADDVGTQSLSIEGLAYVLYGGRATWDFSARGDSQTGQIQIAGLQQFWTASLYDSKGALVASATVPAGGSVAAVDVYGASSKIRAFPFEGYFVVRDGPSIDIYRSPILSLWGGDKYTYQATDFYPNANIDTMIHDRPACVLEYQTGRGASPEVPIKSCSRYTSQGLMDVSKALDVSVWRQSTYAYDNYGQVAITTDPKGNNVFYDRSATYSGAYITRVRDSVGTMARSTYDPATGWPLATMDGRGYLTRFAYDALGRPTRSSSFDLSLPSELLYADMEWTTEESTPRLEDLSGHGNHGTIYGTSSVPGKVGMARDFNGVGDRIGTNVGTTAQGTVSFWVQPDSPLTTYQVPLGIKNAAGDRYLLIDQDGQPKWRFVVNTDGSESALVGTSSVVAGKWTHLAATWNEAANTFQLYVNGVLQASSTGITDNPTALIDKWQVGASKAGWNQFNGRIDEVRVFNLVLPAPDILSLYSNSYRLLSSSQMAIDDVGNSMTAYEPTTRARALYFDMDSLLNGNMEDVSGHGAHGSLFGTTPATGKAGNARDFDGIDDRIVAPPSPSTMPDSSVSIALWVYPDTIAGSTRRLVLRLGTNPLRGFNLDIQPGGQVRFEVFDSAGSVDSLLSTGIVPTGSWTHVAAVWSPAGQTLYLNGAQDSTRTPTISFIGANPDNLYIGSWNGGEPFDGRLDEVQLFDSPLSATNVSNIYQAKESGSYQEVYFDSLGRTTRIVRRDLFQTLVSWNALTYNFRDQVATRTVARNASTSFTTTYGYDFLGRPTSATYPGTAPPVSISFDAINRIRTVVAENGRKTQYLYDLGGRMTAVREYYDAWNYYTTASAYDEVGNLLSVSNALSQVTQHQYDNLNRLTKTIYPDTTKYETYTYDEVGNLKTKTDRASQVTTYGYDTRYRLTSIDYAGTSWDVSYGYDLGDNPITVSNPSSSVTYVYDGLGRATNETDTIAGTAYGVGYTYDAAGRLTRLAYPDNTAVSYLYDSVGRTSQAKDASTTYATLTYNADDLTKDVTFGNGVVESYVYNGRAWPTSIKATYGANTYLDLAYTYDNSGNVVTMGSTSLTYDTIDRLRTASGGFGSHTYTYDAIGNRKKLHYGGGLNGDVILRPDGATSTTQWSKSGSGGANWDRVDETLSDGDTTYVYTSTTGNTDLYSLQDLSQTGQINSVTVTAIARGVWSNACDPDCFAVLKLRVNGYAGPVQYAGDFTAYDSVSQTWTTNPATGQPWTMSEVNALQAGVEKSTGIGTAVSVRVTQLYVTVNIGNEATYVYSDGATGLDQMTSMTDNTGATSVLGYDPNGNLVSKFGATKTCYAWNPTNLLTQVKTVSAACAETGSQVQAYTYDGLGRRIKVDGTSSSTWTLSIVSGMDVIYEKDQSGAITKYVYGRGLRIAKITSSGVQYYLSDHLGSTRKVLDASRNTVFSTDYEPFGRPVAPNGTEAYTYTSEKHDDPTGLIYLRARQYDPEIGRFVSADPILGSLSKPQTQDRYVYVANNPMKFRDPSGRLTMPSGGFQPPRPSGSDPVTQLYNWVFNGGVFESHVPGLPSDFPPCNPGRCYNPSHNVANQWRGLDPNVRNAIMVVTVLVVGTILTAGAIDLIGAAALGGDAAIGGGAAGVALDEGAAGIPEDAIAAADGGVKEGLEEIVAGGRTFQLTEHAQKQMAERGISREALTGALEESPFDYVHQGITKQGYFDPITNTFAGTVEGRITTVVQGSHVRRYVEGLGWKP